MVPKSKQMSHIVRNLLPISGSTIPPKHGFAKKARRAASTSGHNLVSQPIPELNASQPVPEPNTPEPPSPSSFEFTVPIRKVIEPPIIASMRILRTQQLRYAHRTADEAAPQPYPAANQTTSSVIHLRPWARLKRQRNPRIKEDSFRDIYYVPPSDDDAKYGKLNFPAKHIKVKPPTAATTTLAFPPPSGSTIPFKTRSFRRVVPKPFHATMQQQRPSPFSTSTFRSSSTPASTPPSPEPLSIDQYHNLADHYIDTLVAKLEEIQEERSEVDCEYSAGVLTLTFPPAGTYVLNKQPPNKQIWLSSPISGPKRYDYVARDPVETDEEKTGGDGAARGGAGVAWEGRRRGEWVYLRDGSTLSGLLREELGVEVDGEGMG